MLRVVRYLILVLVVAGCEIEPVASTSPQPPYERIASATLGTDEILLELVAPERIVGLSPFCDDPSYSNILDKSKTVKGRVQAQAEQILVMNPDIVVLATYNNPDFISLIERAGISTLKVGSFRTIEEIFGNIERIGNALSVPEKATRIIEDGRQRIQKVGRTVAGLKKPSVLYLDHGWVSGADTIQNEMIEIAGGVNYASEQGIVDAQQIAIEVLQLWQPDVVLFVGLETRPLDAETLPVDAAPLANMNAVKRGRCFEVPARIFTSTSQYAVEGPEILAKLLHPVEMTSHE